METNKMINELQNLVLELDVETLSTLQENDYKNFILNFFSKVNQLKRKGLIIDDLFKRYIDARYFDISDYFDENPVYEERIQDIFTELTEFCSPPKFWNTPFEEYMKVKWGIDINK